MKSYQRSAALEIAERKFPKRVISPIMQRSMGGLGSSWDIDIFRAGTAILPNCLPIQTQIATNNGEIVEKAQCSAIPEIQSGLMVCTAENYIGSICRLVCDEGFLGHGYGDKNESRLGLLLLAVLPPISDSFSR